MTPPKGPGPPHHSLPATDRHTGRSVVLHLCEGCRESRTRTWRLRYAPEKERSGHAEARGPVARAARLQRRGGAGVSFAARTAQDN